MKRILIHICCTITVLILGSHYGLAQKAEELFQKGIQLEEVKGDLAKAIELYADVVKTSTTNKSLTAKALLHIGRCYEKLGKKEATKAYERIVKDFADQREVVMEARSRLLALENASQSKKVPELSARQLWTGSGVDIEGGISADGRYLSFTDWSTGDLALRDMNTRTIRRLTNKSSRSSKEYADFSTVSPDGKQVAYAWLDERGNCSLRAVGIDGSGERILYRGTGEYLLPEAWSRDGKEILAVLWGKGAATHIAMISTLDSSLRILKSFDSGSPGKTAISPDGRWIAYDGVQGGNSQDHDIFLLAVDGTHHVRLIEHPANDVSPVWAPDGRSILFVSDRGGAPGFWLVSVLDDKAQGSPRLVKPDIGNVRPFGIASNGTLYYGLAVGGDDVYAATIEPTSGKLLAAPVAISGRFVGFNSAPACSPDGQLLAYISTRGSNQNFWTPGNRILVIRSLKTGKERECLVNFGPGFELSWAPDSRSFMVPGKDSANPVSLFQVDAEAGTSKVLMGRVWTSSEGSAAKGWFPDGKSIYLTRGTPMRLVRHDLASKEQKEIFSWKGDEVNFRFTALSPDGKQFASWREDLNTGLFGIVLISAEGGEPREVFSLRKEDMFLKKSYGGLSWTADGRYVMFARRTEAKEKMDLWRVAVGGGEPERLGPLSQQVHTLVVHPDGKRIFFSTSEKIWDVWAMENFLSETMGPGTVEQKDFKLTKIHTGAYVSCISPDGRKLVLSSPPQILVKDMESGKETPLAIEVSRTRGEVVWSQDGNMIAYLDKANNLSIVPSAGGSSTILVMADSASAKAGDTMIPKGWTSDSKKLVLHVPAKGLFTISVPGGTMEGLLTFDDAGEAREYEEMTLSPNGKLVAFVSSKSGNKDIYVIPVKGQKAIQITKSPVDDTNPRWSYDGTMISFLSRRTESPEIWVVKISPDGRPEGSELQVSRGGYWGGTWTKDGMIGYCTAYRTDHIYTANSDGSEEVQVTHFPAFSGSPRWSPDGKRIIFSSDYGQQLNKFRMWTIPSTGGEAKLLVAGAKAGSGLSYCFSPDGETIAFVDYESQAKKWSIKLSPADGGEPKELFSDDKEIGNLEWSPDGQQIMFIYTKVPSRYADADEYMKERLSGISMIPIVGRDVKNIVRDEKKGLWVSGCCWSPDGSEIAYRTFDYAEWMKGGRKEEGISIWVKDTKTGAAKLIAKSGDGYKLCWSPGGKSIIFEKRIAGMEFELYQVPAGGGMPEKLNIKGRSPVFSPDGKKIAYSRRIGQGYEFWLAENLLKAD